METESVASFVKPIGALFVGRLFGRCPFLRWDLICRARVDAAGLPNREIRRGNERWDVGVFLRRQRRFGGNC